jgi:hypothetical protein
MKYFSGLIFLAIVTYLVWPYVHLYQLNDAVINNDQVAFEKLLDVEAVRKVYKENIEWKTSQLGPQEKNVFSDLMRQGANFFGNTAVDTMINANWILGRLRRISPVWDQVTFAFFESPTRFTIRLGELGHNPIHIQMTLQDWYWRVTAIYE